MRLASLNPLRPFRALALRVEQRAAVLRDDTLTTINTVVHASEGRVVAFLRSIESRITAAAEQREERIRAHIDERFDAISAEIASFRARHGFVGDPVVESPAVTSAGERMVPRRPPSVDPRLPAGRPHP